MELVAQPPTTATQLLAVVAKHAAAMNAAVQHLPSAPVWQVSAAVKASAKLLVQLLQGGAAAGSSSSSRASGPQASGLGHQDAPAAATGLNVDGGDSSSNAAAAAAAAAGGLPIMVGGVLAPAPADTAAAAAAAGEGAEQKQKQKKKRLSKTDEAFRQRMIRKFSAKSQVGGGTLEAWLCTCQLSARSLFHQCCVACSTGHVHARPPPKHPQVYDNCRMLSSTGDLLCFCDMRKLCWYTDKGLAELVQEVRGGASRVTRTRPHLQG
jgi:hypothetical protein